MEYVPITVSLNGESFRDGIDVTRDEMYDKLMNGKDFPKTSQPSPQEFLNVFEAAKSQGDEIIYIGVSSALSGTLQSAHLARTMADYDGIHIIDSLTATYPIRIMAEYAMELRDGGTVGYEIPFTRHFYEYTPLRPSSEILAEIRELEAGIAEKLQKAGF